MIVLVGTSHQSAPVDVRERLALPPGDVGEALSRLVQQPGLQEAMILSTCNRVEVVAYGAEPAGALESVRAFLAAERGFSDAELQRYTYCHRGDAAVRHLFSVTSGLESMILGEPQIVGQVKQAYDVARQQGTTGPFLDRLLQCCFATSKRVRTETDISRNAVSVAFAAVELGRNIFGDLSGKKALLVGAGKMSSLVARHLTGRGVTDIVVASRSFDHAAELAAECGGRPVHWEEGLLQLSAVDIAVSCTHSPGFVLSYEDVEAAVRLRRGQPLFLIDIAVPRDIDPRANELDNAYLYDIDGLQDVVDANRDARRKASQEAKLLIDRDVDAFDRWRQGREIAPMIVALRGKLHRIAEAEVQRVRRRHAASIGSAGQNGALEELSRAIVQKLLHRPIKRLQSAVERGDVDRCVELYAELFDVNPEDVAGALDAEREQRDDEKRGDDEPPASDGPRLIRGGKDG